MICGRSPGLGGHNERSRVFICGKPSSSRAAALIAGQGPPEAGEPRLTLEQAEEFTRLIVRADSFTAARVVLEDMAEEAAPANRWVFVDALDEAAAEWDEKVKRYKRDLGFS